MMQACQEGHEKVGEAASVSINLNAFCTHVCKAASSATQQVNGNMQQLTAAARTDMATQ